MTLTTEVSQISISKIPKNRTNYPALLAASLLAVECSKGADNLSVKQSGKEDPLQALLMPPSNDPNSQSYRMRRHAVLKLANQLPSGVRSGLLHPRELTNYIAQLDMISTNDKLPLDISRQLAHQGLNLPAIQINEAQQRVREFENGSELGFTKNWPFDSTKRFHASLSTASKSLQLGPPQKFIADSRQLENDFAKVVDLLMKLACGPSALLVYFMERSQIKDALSKSFISKTEEDIKTAQRLPREWREYLTEIARSAHTMRPLRAALLCESVYRFLGKLGAEMPKQIGRSNLYFVLNRLPPLGFVATAGLGLLTYSSAPYLSFGLMICAFLAVAGYKAHCYLTIKQMSEKILRQAKVSSTHGST